MLNPMRNRGKMTVTNQNGSQGMNPPIFPPTGRGANPAGGRGFPAPERAYGNGVNLAAGTGGGASFQADNREDKNRTKWLIAIVIAVLVLLVLLFAWVAVWLMGGDSQGARSACLKSSQDLTKQYNSLQETAKKADQLVQNTEVSSLPDPQVLYDLKLKSLQAHQPVKTLACDSGLKQAGLAKNTSAMIAAYDKLTAQLDDLNAAIKALGSAQNMKGLDEVKSGLENTVKTGNDLMAQAESEKIADSQAPAALKAQLDDAKRLLDQVSSLKQVSSDKANELSESMEAAKNRLDEDIDALKKAISKNREDKARQEAENKLRQQELQRQEQERQEADKLRQQSHSPNPGSGRENQDDSGNGVSVKKPALCDVGSTMTDPQGRHWRCVNVLDPDTGTSSSVWMQDDAPQS